MIELEDLQPTYIPEEDSYYRLEIPKSYDSLFAKYEENGYVELMRESALFFKLKSTETKYSTTMGAREAGEFLTKISKSFGSYIEEDFYNLYKEVITDYNKLKKVISKFKNNLEPRVSQLSYSSFEVGLSVDIVNNLYNGKYKDWQKDILNKYKENVIDVNYSNDEELKEIAKKYTEESRKKIFSPIIDIINNKKYSLESYNQTKTFKKSFKSIDVEKKEILIPKIIQEKEDEAKKKFFHAVFELGEDDDVSKVSKSQLSTGLLFSQPLEEVDYPLDKVSSHGITLSFKETIYYKFYIDSNLYYCAEIPDLDISISSKDKDEARRAINDKIVELYLNKEEVDGDLRLRLINLIGNVQDDNYNLGGSPQLPPPKE